MRVRKKGYWLYLVPSLVLILVVIVVPFLMNLGVSLTRWSGVGTPRWAGLENYARLLEDERFWLSFQNNVALIFAMAVVPTVLGLLLAAARFDFLGESVRLLAASTTLA